MTVNPNTLYGLYYKGILDYVPMDLCMPTPIASFGNMQNPYMNSAMSGNLYQQHGNGYDTFTQSQGQYGYVGNPYANLNNGYNSMNTPQYNGQIGSQASGGLGKIFGFSGGGQNQAQGPNMFGQGGGIGVQSNQSIENNFGGFGDFKNNIKSTASKVGDLPTWIKGIASGAILLGTLIFCFKGKKKPKGKQAGSLLSKLNPLKLFKKK